MEGESGSQGSEFSGVNYGKFPGKQYISNTIKKGSKRTGLVKEKQDMYEREDLRSLLETDRPSWQKGTVRRGALNITTHLI